MPQDFISRMQQYETTAPPGMWAKIADQLNETDEYASLSTKMQAYEVSAPANAWKNIEAAIDNSYTTNNTAKVIPMFALRKIAVAAAFIGLIATGMWYFKISINSASAFLQNITSTNKSGDKQTLQNKHSAQAENNSYITIQSPSGGTTHISAKLNKAVKFMGNSLSNDATNNEEKIWKERVDKWRTKILQSNYTPANGNFLDIIELQKLLEEQ